MKQIVADRRAPGDVHVLEKQLKLALDMFWVLSDFGEEVKAWEKDTLLRSGHQECRIYRLQGHFAETRDK